MKHLTLSLTQIVDGDLAMRMWVRHMVLLGRAYLRGVLKSCAPILQRIANSSLFEQMPRSLARLSASESSHRGLSSAVFTTNTAESDFWYTQPLPWPCGQ